MRGPCSPQSLLQRVINHGEAPAQRGSLYNRQRFTLLARRPFVDTGKCGAPANVLGGLPKQNLTDLKNKIYLKKKKFFDNNKVLLNDICILV